MFDTLGDRLESKFESVLLSDRRAKKIFLWDRVYLTHNCETRSQIQKKDYGTEKYVIR